MAVEPGTLSGQDGAHAAATCQNVLDTHGPKDVEVALMESTSSGRPTGVMRRPAGCGGVGLWRLLQQMTAEQELSAEERGG